MNASGRVEKGDIGQIELLTKNRAYNTLSLWNTLFHWQSIDCYNLLVLVQKARICCMSSKLCICHTTIFHWWSSGWYHYFFVLVKARIGCRGLHICRWILCSLWHGQASLEDLGLVSHSRKFFWNVATVSGLKIPFLNHLKCDRRLRNYWSRSCHMNEWTSTKFQSGHFVYVAV